MAAFNKTFQIQKLHFGIGNLFNFISKESPFTSTISKRYYPPLVKRLYADTIVCPVENHYEIHLDNRKLKTPKQKVFQIQNEGLAHMIASEWSSQRKHISQTTMHLTALANTTQDNPLYKSKLTLIDEMLNLLPEDTLLYYTVDNEKLMALQIAKWKPIMDWFEKEFQVQIPIILDSLLPPTISDEVERILRNYFMSLSYASIQGLAYGMAAIKSVILTLAVAKGRVTAEEAVHLSRLEVSYQVGYWGNVEWFHDTELYDSVARLSAAILFYHCHTSTSEILSK